MFSCFFPHPTPPQVEAPSSRALLLHFLGKRSYLGHGHPTPLLLQARAGEWAAAAAGQVGRLCLTARSLQPLLCVAAGAAALSVTLAVPHCLGAGGSYSLCWAGEHRPRTEQCNTACSGSWPGWQIIPEKGSWKGPLEVSVPASAEGGGFACPTKTALFCLLFLRGDWLCLPCATHLCSEIQLLQPAGKTVTSQRLPEEQHNWVQDQEGLVSGH